MKNLLYIMAICFVSNLGFSQATQTENYVQITSYQVETQDGTTNANTNAPLVSSDKLISVSYFDGLGRALQSVAVRAGGNSEDIVTYITYDDFGRMDKEHLPYATTTTDGSFRTNAESATNNFYNTTKYENTNNPFSQKLLENSPLNRVLKQAAPGNSWALSANGTGADNAIEFDYQTNTATDNVKLFRVDLTSTTVSNVLTYVPTLENTNGEEYGAGELYKTITRDENHAGTTKNHTTEEFKNKQGQVVLKRTYADITGENQARHDTYYVYDDYGNLTYVLPPKMNASSATLTTINTQLNNLGYQYKYDYRNRLVEKRIPGKGWEYIVYNTLDQPIMTQDTILKTQGKWLITKYDAFGRVVYTGIKNTTSSRTYFQNVINGEPDQYESKVTSGTGYLGTYYTSNSTPTSLNEVYTINYYDDYDFLDSETNFSLPTQGFQKNIENHDNTNKKLTKGLATGSKVRVLETSDWITTVMGYDDKGQAIYTESRNDYLETVDIVESQLDFTGKPTKVKATHTKNSSTITTLDNFTYDHMGRLEAQTQCIGDETMGYACVGGSVTVANLILTNDSNITGDQAANNSITVTNSTIKPDTRLFIATGGEELIVLNSYDELGQLENKKVGGDVATTLGSSTGLQTVDYTYSIRGWLKQINNPASLGNDLFGFKIAYNDPTDFGGNENPDPLYNGNISQTFWTSQSQNSTSNLISERYSYNYDALNRIESAYDNTNNYSLSLVDYDKNGNIQHLNRKGHTNVAETTFGNMDNLTYGYDGGNKLLSVTDAITTPALMKGEFKDENKNGDDYRYDTNGNMVMDKNKGIGTDAVDGISYNHLNLPTNVVVGGGNISYIYDATGVKQKKIVSTGSNTLYAGNYIYEGTSGNESLQFFNHPEGYVEPNGSNFDYVYQYKDHLGNIRLSYSDADNNGSINASTEIVSEKNYYPFGLQHKGYNNVVSGNSNSAANKFGFGGKELQDDNIGGNQLDWLDFGARNYDASLGRWMNPDPLEQFMSPYLYAGNDPIRYMDPTGMYSTEEWKKDNGITDDDLITIYQAPNDEYDKDGNKISNLGGDETDFYHQENGDTKIINRKSKKSNTIAGGMSLIKNYMQRNGKTSYKDIFNEFIKGTGPEKSIMYGSDHQMNEGIIDSYQFFKAAGKFMKSDKDKMMVKGTFGIFGAIRAGVNMVEQMLGKANISMYKLGDNVVFLVTDAKSRSSWSLNPFDGDGVNVPRKDGKIIPKSNTHQTYIFSLTKKQVNDAIEDYDIGHGEF